MPLILILFKIYIYHNPSIPGATGSIPRLAHWFFHEASANACSQSLGFRPWLLSFPSPVPQPWPQVSDENRRIVATFL